MFHRTHWYAKAITNTQSHVYSKTLNYFRFSYPGLGEALTWARDVFTIVILKICLLGYFFNR